MNTAKAVFGLALLGAAQASHAGFITIGNPANDITMNVVSNNDFINPQLTGVGVTEYTLGASLGLTDAGYVTFYYYGKEAGYTNTFSAGSLSYSTGPSQLEDYFGGPIKIGPSLAVGAGALSFQFCSESYGVSVGCIDNAQNDGLGVNAVQSIAMNISGNTAWLFWDDSGAGPDDNHDDMLIKAVYTTMPVPEPGSLALFSLGLLGMGFGIRRQAKNC